MARLLVEGHFEDVGARGEAGVVLFEGGDQLVALVADHAVEGEEAGIDNRGDLVETRVELAEVLRTRAHQGNAGALGGVVEGAAEFDHRRLELALHRVDLDGDRLVELLGQRRHQRLGFLGARGDVGGDAVADHFERGRNLVAAIAQLVEQGNAALAEELGERRGAVLDGVGEGGGAAVECFGEGRHALVDDGAEFSGPAFEGTGNGVGAVLERDVEARGAVVEGREQIAGALVDERHEALGALAEGAVERIAGAFQRLGQVAAGFDDGAGDALADHVEVENEAGMALGDRFADALGVGDDGFALAGQFLDQGAHARFIVGIGAFERGDLVVDHHFEFAGARQGALEAIAEGVDFAADGLADRGDFFGRGGLGFGETDGGVGDGGGGVAQVLGATDQRRDGHEAEDRNQRDGDEADEIVRGKEAGRAEILAVADEADGEDGDDPDDRDDGGNEAGRRVVARLQTVKNAAALHPVVIGDGAGERGLFVGDARALRPVGRARHRDRL